MNQISVIFEQPNGEEHHCVARCGDTLMDVALDNGVPGIVAQCGGGCTCCTCHCWIQSPWFERIPGAGQDEIDILAYAWGVADNSRLACQVVLTADLDGLRAWVPAQQSLN